MSTITLTGHVDDQHRLTAEVPDSIPPGPVRLVIASLSDEDEAGDAWMVGIAREWTDELNDPAQDIYTLSDGEPVREA